MPFFVSIGTDKTDLKITIKICISQYISRAGAHNLEIPFDNIKRKNL